MQRSITYQDDIQTSFSMVLDCAAKGGNNLH